jgi:hypothetical protein
MRHIELDRTIKRLLAKEWLTSRVVSEFEICRGAVDVFSEECTESSPCADISIAVLIERKAIRSGSLIH